MKEVFRKPRDLALLSLAAAGIAFSGCGESDLDGNNNQFYSTQTVEADGSEWTVRCEGPVTPTPVAVKEDDTLLNMIYDNTDVIQPAGLGREDLPVDALVGIIAELNDIEDPDVITLDQSFDFPARCSITTPSE